MSFHKQEHKWENMRTAHWSEKIFIPHCMCWRSSCQQNRLCAPDHMVFICQGGGGVRSSSIEHVSGHNTSKWPEVGFWRQRAQGPMPELLFLTYVTLGTWPSVSMPQFINLYSRRIVSTYASEVTKIKWVNLVKHTEQHLENSTCFITVYSMMTINDILT